VYIEGLELRPGKKSTILSKSIVGGNLHSIPARGRKRSSLGASSHRRERSSSLLNISRGTHFLRAGKGAREEGVNSKLY